VRAVRGDRARVSERRLEFSWDDPAVALRGARSLPGRTYLEGVRDGRFPPPPFVKLLGIRLRDVGDGSVTFVAEPAEYAYNTISLVHGGWIATILDSAIGCAVTTKMPAGKFAVTLDLQVRYFKPLTASTGGIACTGTLLNLGRTTGTAEARLLDGSGRLHAHATSTLSIVEAH
jgi:uncharacterized protein (TIGR00369 family)